MSPDAGQQLRRASRRWIRRCALVERLGTLYRTSQQMPGTQAATSAQHARVLKWLRVCEGVEAYEGPGLLQRAELIAAPFVSVRWSRWGAGGGWTGLITGGLRKAADNFADPLY